MDFTFPQLVAHACGGRPLSTGSVVGVGTIASDDRPKGLACLTKRLNQEVTDGGTKTEGLKSYDEMFMDAS